MLGIGGDSKKVKTLKRKIDYEIGFGGDFMDFLDDIEQAVQLEGDEGYERKARKFEEESDEEDYAKEIASIQK